MPAVDYLTQDEALKLAFPDSTVIEPFAGEPTAEQLDAVAKRAKSRAQGKGRPRAWVGRTGDRLDGVALIDHVIGRTEYITFLCALDADGKVRRLEVMAYRESQGGEVRNRRFLEQFAGKGSDDPLRRGREITNIGGATLSVDALTERTRYLLDYHAVVVAPVITVAPAPAPAVVPNQIPAEPGARFTHRAAAIGNSALTIRIDHDGSDSARRDAEANADAALALAGERDAVLNAWRDDSEVSRLNRAGAGEISQPLLAALSAVRDAWTTTGGRFDPTVGPLILAWKRAAEAGHEPAADELAELRATLGFGRVVIDAERRRVELPAGAVLDLGGIAKGLIVDTCAESIAARLRPGERALIGFGESSQRLVAGAGNGQAPALIALRHPARPEELHQMLELRPGQGFGYASASGRVFRIGERTYSHLIDPLTGAPGAIERAAAVIAPSAAIADGLDTALCLLDPDEALALCARLGVEALLWDGVRFRQTAGWPVRP